jgi:hypothetical protein
MEDWIAFIRSVWDEVEQPSMEVFLAFDYLVFCVFIHNFLFLQGWTSIRDDGELCLTWAES